MKKSIIKLIFLALLLINLQSCGLYQYMGIDSYSGTFLFPAKLNKINPGMSDKEVLALMGTPTVVSTFNNKVWYYIYQKSKSFAIFRENILEQNTLILTFDDKGILLSKKLQDLKSSRNIPYLNDASHLNYKKSLPTVDSF